MVPCTDAVFGCGAFCTRSDQGLAVFMRVAHNTWEHIVHSVLDLFTGYCSATFRYFDRYINKSTYEVQPRRMEGTSTLQVLPFFIRTFLGSPYPTIACVISLFLTSWGSNLSFSLLYFPSFISPNNRNFVSSFFIILR